MKNEMKKIEEKQTYYPPIIERIKLDNEISLALESDPPFGPGEESFNNVSEFSNNDPFRINIS